MHRILLVSLIFVIGQFLSLSSRVDAQNWREEKSEHFIIKYQFDGNFSTAKNILRKAELYYDKIGTQVGFTRYGDFWTWDNRVTIILYPNHDAFINNTGLPPWSRGGVIRDNRLKNTGTIITYKQENEFLDGVLPHEIAHLVIRDYLGKKTNIPLWFDEGFAQYQEKNKVEVVERVIRRYVKKDKYIPIAKLMHMDVRREFNPDRVAMFYGQSVSIVNFLIKSYGSYKFSELCSKLSNEEPFETALKRTYSAYISSLGDLEEKWLNYIKN